MTSARKNDVMRAVDWPFYEGVSVGVAQHRVLLELDGADLSRADDMAES